MGEWEPESGRPTTTAGLEVVIDIQPGSDLGPLTFEVTLPDGSTRTYDRELRPGGGAYLLDFGVPRDAFSEGTYEVSVRGARDGYATCTGRVTLAVA